MIGASPVEERILELLEDIRDSVGELVKQKNRKKDDWMKIDDFSTMVGMYINSVDDMPIRDAYLESLPFVERGYVFVNSQKLLDYIQSDGLHLEVTRQDINRNLAATGWAKRICTRRFDGRDATRAGPRWKYVKRNYWFIHHESIR